MYSLLTALRCIKWALFGFCTAPHKVTLWQYPRIAPVQSGVCRNTAPSTPARSTKLRLGSPSLPGWTMQLGRASVIEWSKGVKTLRTQDTSDPRHFGTSAEVSYGHFAELSGHFGTKDDCYGWGMPAQRWTLTSTMGVVRGHAKLRGRVRRVLQRRGCIKLVRCKRGCYIVKQHCPWCVRAGENELSRSDPHSITGLCLCAQFSGLSMSVCLQNCTENQVSTVTTYFTHC